MFMSMRVVTIKRKCKKHYLQLNIGLAEQHGVIRAASPSDSGLPKIAVDVDSMHLSSTYHSPSWTDQV